jgi:hypothetical protein
MVHDCHHQLQGLALGCSSRRAFHETVSPSSVWDETAQDPFASETSSYQPFLRANMRVGFQALQPPDTFTWDTSHITQHITHQTTKIKM